MSEQHKLLIGYGGKSAGDTIDVTPDMKARYIERGIIAGGKASAQAVEDLDDLTTDNLKDRLRALGLLVGGKKADLVKRLREATE